MNWMTRCSVVAAAALCFSACAGGPEPSAAAGVGNAHGVDSIVVTFSASGRLDADDVQTVEITDAATVDLWVAALDAVPEVPARGIRYIRFQAPISQHRVELRKGEQTVRVARMRSGQLDVDAHEGWAFYSGEDKEFTALVNAVVPGK